uniref:Uncharacterized protein n=1 Tax=Plectus sambesii TaxID=2011161 RepID=A0A914UXV3_9BILA
MLEATKRVFLAVSAAMAIGYVYYDPDINPLAKTFFKIVPTFQQGELVAPLVGTAIAKALLAFFIYSYVYNRNDSLWQLVRMASDLTFMSALLQFTHYLWTPTDLRVLGINTLYDLIITVVISIIVGYKRFHVKVI